MTSTCSRRWVHMHVPLAFSDMLKGSSGMTMHACVHYRVMPKVVSCMGSRGACPEEMRTSGPRHAAAHMPTAHMHFCMHRSQQSWWRHGSGWQHTQHRTVWRSHQVRCKL